MSTHALVKDQLCAFSAEGPLDNIPWWAGRTVVGTLVFVRRKKKERGHALSAHEVIGIQNQSGALKVVRELLPVAVEMWAPCRWDPEADGVLLVYRPHDWSMKRDPVSTVRVRKADERISIEWRVMKRGTYCPRPLGNVLALQFAQNGLYPPDPLRHDLRSNRKSAEHFNERLNRRLEREQELGEPL